MQHKRGEKGALPEIPKGLTPREALFLRAYLSGLTVREAAKKAHISRDQATRYKNRPRIKRFLARYVEAMIEEALDDIWRLCDGAVSTLRQAMERGPYGARVQAARVVLAAVVKLREMELAAKREEQQSIEPRALPPSLQGWPHEITVTLPSSSEVQ